MSMQLRLEGSSVLVLGPGDELDRAVARSLAEAGASTLVTRETSDGVDLTQHSTSGAAHWVSTEPHIDEDVVRRLTRFLDDIDMTSTNAVVRVHLPPVKRVFGFWPLRRDARRHRRELVRTVLAALEAQTDVVPSVTLVLWAEPDLRDQDAHRHVRACVQACLKALRARGEEGRVNAVVVTSPSSLPAAADAIALLASDTFTGLSGAILPFGLQSHALWPTEEGESEDLDEAKYFA